MATKETEHFVNGSARGHWVDRLDHILAIPPSDMLGGVRYRCDPAPQMT